MTQDTAAERRILLFAPFGRDAELVGRMLRDAGIECRACATLAELVREADGGAAALLVAEEALGKDAPLLIEFLRRQPPWSDLPVLILARDASDFGRLQAMADALGNVTLIERPVRVAALRSSARTALRARERQYALRAHLLEREEENRRKDEFLAVLAHELRNPLAPISYTVELLRRPGAEKASDDLWGMIERQVRHMVRLVDDLLEVSRITRGKIELRRERIELAAVIASAVETSRPLIEASRHRLTVELAPGPLPLDADPTRLAQVFANLLNNAAKYSAPGGDIRVTAERADGEVVVRVCDAGIGITAEVLPRIFDMFVQAGAAEGTVQSGLGIGLTLARRLVEMHGGSISARSDGPGCGSEFTVRLPLASGPAPAKVRHAEGTRRVQRRVLVVDDNRDAADSLGALLKALGAEVEIAHSGETALADLERYRPQVVFLDIGMPGLDGYEVARRIRRREDGRELQLVAVTGYGQDQHRRLARDAGFDHHLVKPADVGALRALLEADRPD